MLSKRVIVVGVAAVAIATAAGLSQRQNSEEQLATKAAQDLLNIIPASQKKELQKEFVSDERKEWSFVPGPHPGLSVKKMDAPSRSAARKLLEASLSEAGLTKVESIRALEVTLRELENGNLGRDAELYYYTIFGDPSSTGDWMFRYQGHHISLSFTYMNGKLISSTPQFLGVNPAVELTGPKKGSRLLAEEEVNARAFLNSLSTEQKALAIQSEEAPFDIITGNSRKASLEKQIGIPYSKLDKTQQTALREIVKFYASILKPEAKTQRLAKIEKSGWSGITFAWMGSSEVRKKHYYRIHGPTFLIEYDNTQNDANHIHTVWRDFEGDFGNDVLSEHYKHGHKHDHDAKSDPNHTH